MEEMRVILVDEVGFDKQRDDLVKLVQGHVRSQVRVEMAGGHLLKLADCFGDGLDGVECGSDLLLVSWLRCRWHVCF